LVGVFCAGELCHPPILYAGLHYVEPTLSWESITLIEARDAPGQNDAIGAKSN
jgi:hypothetical protein